MDNQIATTILRQIGGKRFVLVSEMYMTNQEYV